MKTMGLFDFGKKGNNKKNNDGIMYRMLFDNPRNGEKEQKIKEWALKYLGEAGVVVDNVNTSTNGGLSSKAEFTGQAGEVITIECAATPSMENSSSFISITVKSNQSNEEAIKKAFQEIKADAIGMSWFFTEF